MSDFETNQEQPSEANQEQPSEANQEQPSEANQDQTINLRVVSQVIDCNKITAKDGNEVFFKIRKTTPLNKLITTYLERQSLKGENLRFLFDGNRIGPNQTPEEMDMEENDIIDVVLMQTGGK